MSVFAKIFSQIFDSSISSDYIVRHTFMDLLVLADRDGVVDMTTDAIARRTNVPEEMIVHAIAKLVAPDAQSRSHEEDGCRLVPIDSHRSWGWQIVNYEHYRNLRDEEARRAYFRDAKREQRSKKCAESPAASNIVKDSPTNSTQVEAEAEAEVQKPLSVSPTPADIIAIWNEAAKGKLPQARNTLKRQAVIRTRLKEPGWLPDFRAACAFIAETDWYAGANDRKWVATIDYPLQAGKATELAEKSAQAPQENSNVGSSKNQQSPAKQRVDGARRVLAEIAISRGLYDPAGADGRPDAQVPQPGPAREHR
jgi:hypothetical protein